MTQSLWGPDGQWIGRRSDPPAAAPVEEADLERVGRFAGTGCLVLVGLVLLVPTLLLAAFALASGASEPTATALATVRSVERGTDDFGDRAYCYTVDYVVDGDSHTYRTCSSSNDAKTVPDGDGGTRSETFEERDARFAAEHPIGSQVEILYQVNDPAVARGGVSEVGSGATGGNPKITAILSGLALVFAAGPALAWRAAWRLSRRRRAAALSPVRSPTAY